MTAGQGYIRWPSVLVNCHWIQNEIDIKRDPELLGVSMGLGPGELPEPPPPPKFHPSHGHDIKLLLFMVYKSAGARDGYGTAKIAEVQEFMGAVARHSIREAVLRLEGQVIRIDPFDLSDGDKQFDQCKLFDFTSRITKSGDIAWKFDGNFMVALAATHHYARLNISALSGLDSFAAVRMYIKFCEISHAGHRQVWQVAINELKAFVNSQARNDNFQLRVLDPALAEIKATGAFYNALETELVYDKGRGRQLAAINFTFSGDGRRRTGARIEKPEEPYSHLKELLDSAEKHQAEQLMEAAKAERAQPWVAGPDLLGELLADDQNELPAPAERRQVAEKLPDAAGRIPKFVVGYLKPLAVPIYHARIPGNVAAICGAAVVHSPVRARPLAWKDARAGTEVSCPKCKTLIRKATSTRPVLKRRIEPPKNAPSISRRRAALIAYNAKVAAIPRPPQLGPLVTQFHNRVGSPPPDNPPPAVKPAFFKKPPKDPA
jgi:hypothetical protein